MDQNELKEVLEQHFAVLSAQIKEDASKREMVFMQKNHEIERSVDKAENKSTEAINRTEAIFRYIDELKPLLPRLDTALTTIADLAKSQREHDERLRAMENKGNTCTAHEQKTDDQEKRIRFIEQKMSQMFGALKLWGGLLGSLTVIIGACTLMVAIFK